MNEVSRPPRRSRLEPVIAVIAVALLLATLLSACSKAPEPPAASAVAILPGTKQ